jgi:hypothetical protein
MKAKDTNVDDPEMVALRVLAWVLADDGRADRLMAMTGMTPAGLRAGIGDRAVLGAVMAFVLGHEPDLVACAEALGIRPEALAEAGRSLE